MKKNLFLTVALALASFVGVNAQNWSVTLDASVGLPGDTVSRDGVRVVNFQSGVIRADKPIKTLRFTCVSNVNGEKPNGNNYVFALSELNVYNAEMTEELSYTVKSNADYNELTKSFDGQGIKALYDGRFDNYFHSMYAEKGAVADYHYLELTFDEPIERFVIEWGSRPGNPKNSPTTVVLTEGGIDAEPYADRESSFSESKITSIADLEAAEYFTIRGNAAEEYNEYDKTTGEVTSKEPLEGSGPMYVTLGSNTSKEPTMDYLAQLVPVEGEDTYYIYFPMQEKYLSGDAEQNEYDKYNNSNGWQYATADIEKAAKITLHTSDNGDFEMSYETVKEGDTYTVYIGAAPQSEGKMKTFEKSQKEHLAEHKWSSGYGIVCAFNWSFYGADYTAPVWAKEYEISTNLVAAKKLANAIIENEISDAGYETLTGAISELEDILKGIEDLTQEEIEEAMVSSTETIGAAIFETAYGEYENDATIWEAYQLNTSETPQPGRFPQSAYSEYLQPGIDLIYEILEAEESAYFTYIKNFTTYCNNKQSNLKAFLASMLPAISLPVEYTTEELALGTLDKVYTWTQDIALNKSVNGIRITFLETNVGGSNSGGKYEGYPMVALSELEIIHNNTKMSLNETLVTTNSQETTEGAMANLFDGKKTTDEGAGSSFWHSIWGNGTMNPKGYVYLDIKFPDDASINAFTIKTISRDANSNGLAPKTVAISEYGKEYVADVKNTYNVAIGNKVTDLSQLKDGGIYVIQGNLKVNTEDEAAPRYYAGVAPYSSDVKTATDTPCAYMFKKVGDDVWNILSLSNAKYWATDANGKMTIYENAADKVKFIDSENLEDTWVIYSPIDTTLTSNYTHEIDSTNSIKFDSVGVKATAKVYMDWDGGLASRPCYSPLPGVADPRFAALTEELKVSSSCGDYLHFNKTNGEGEWTIYEASIDDAYYVYLQALVKNISELNLVTGNNPGCIVADAEVSAEFDNAKAAASVAVKEGNRENAEALATNLASALNKIGLERVGFDSEAVYRIESALENFVKNTWYTRSIYANDESKLAWTVTPESYNDENHEFLFRVIEVNDDLIKKNPSWRLNPEESEADKDYIIHSINKNKYIDDEFGCADRPAIKVIETLDVCVFNIKETKTANKNHNGVWHANNHFNGNGYGSNLVYYAGGVNSASSWTFIYMGEAADYPLSVEDVVVKGDEVVSVSYYTAAGMAISEPVKGINIVVTTYANGVVEAKKVLVK